MQKNKIIMIIFVGLSLISLIMGVHGESQLKYDNVSVKFNGPNVIVTSPYSSSPLNMNYLSIFEFTIIDGNHAPEGYRETLSPSGFEQSQNSTNENTSIVFTSELDNGAVLRITYFKYNEETTITLGTRDFQVGEDLLHARYSITNWNFTGEDHYLSIHTSTTVETGTSSSGRNRTGWFIDSDSIDISANTVQKKSGTYSEYDDQWFAPTDPEFDGGTGSDGISTFAHYGIGLLGGNQTSTDVFYYLKADPTVFGIISTYGKPLAIGIAITGAVGTGYWYMRRGSKGILNGGVIIESGTNKEVIKELFQSKSVLYFYLMGNAKVEDEEIKSKIEQAVPHDLYSFKFLMDPVRLSMTKYLYENITISTTELREILDLDWNKFNTHLNALKEHGYVMGEYKFVDGSRQQILTLLPHGEDRYKMLTDLLQLFLDSTASLNLDESNFEISQTDDDLFPLK